MGLDMYLHKRTYVKNWEHMTPEEKHTITIEKDGKVSKNIKPERISHIVEQVGYWRKFNALHKWFVENIQGGNDDCGEYYIDIQDLKRLMEDLKSINNDANMANQKLPTANGFFFGGTEYDAYYFSEVQRTILLIEELLGEDESGSFYYSSSW